MTPAALALWALLAAGAPPPLACPAGAEPRGVPPPEGSADWCEAPGPDGRGRKEGPSRTFYDDGGPWLVEAYHDGQRDGPSVEYHRGGAKAREGSWAAGRKVGRWLVYGEEGTVEEEAPWKDGVLDGPFVQRWPGGVVRTSGRYCHGVQCGVWKTFDAGGKLLGSMEYGEQGDRP